MFTRVRVCLPGERATNDNSGSFSEEKIQQKLQNFCLENNLLQFFNLSLTTFTFFLHNTFLRTFRNIYPSYIVLHIFSTLKL